MYQLYNKRPCVKKQGLLAVHLEPKHNVVIKYIRPFCIDKKRKNKHLRVFCKMCVLNNSFNVWLFFEFLHKLMVSRYEHE